MEIFRQMNYKNPIVFENSRLFKTILIIICETLICQAINENNKLRFEIGFIEKVIKKWVAWDLNPEQLG